MKINFTILLLCSILITHVLSIKILTIISTPSKSHWITAQNLMQELVRSGHEITMVSPYPLKKPPANYRDVSIVESIEKFKQEMQDGLFEEMNWNLPELMYSNLIFCHDVTNFTLKHPNVVKLMQSNERFDLIFLEIFMNDVFLGFHHYYKAPVIGISPMGITPWISYLVGNPMPYSYVPHIFSEFTEHMGFQERFMNALTNIVEDYTIETTFLPLQVRYQYFLKCLQCFKMFFKLI